MVVGRGGGGGSRPPARGRRRAAHARRGRRGGVLSRSRWRRNARPHPPRRPRPGGGRGSQRGGGWGPSRPNAAVRRPNPTRPPAAVLVTGSGRWCGHTGERRAGYQAARGCGARACAPLGKHTSGKHSHLQWIIYRTRAYSARPERRCDDDGGPERGEVVVVSGGGAPAASTQCGCTAMTAVVSADGRPRVKNCDGFHPIHGEEIRMHGRMAAASTEESVG